MHMRSRLIPSIPGWDPASWSGVLSKSSDAAHERLVRLRVDAVDVAALLDAELLVPSFAGPHLPLPLLLDGVVLTRRLSAAELAGGYVELDPDLSPLLEPVRAGVALAAGGRVRLADVEGCERLGLPPSRAVALGPPRWLDGLTPGALAVFSLAHGALHIDAATVDPAVHRKQERALRRTLEAMRRHVRRRGVDVPAGAPWAVTVRELVRELLVEAPDRFAGVDAPLSAQLAAAGLDTAHGWVAAAGTDLSGYAPRIGPDVPAAELAARIGAEVDLDVVEELERSVLQHRAGILSEDPAQLRRHGAALADEALMAIFWARMSTDPGLVGFLERVLPHTREQARAATHLLLAWAAEGSDDVPAHRRHLREAMAPLSFAPAIREAVDALIVQGEAAAAASIWRSHLGGTDDDEALTRIEGWVERDPLPLHGRAPWLWEKAHSHLLRPAQLHRIRTRVVPGMDLEAAIFGVFGGFLAECAMLDQGGLASFLALRGFLLPDDERALATSWLDAPPGLWQVEGVDAGAKLLLRDVRTGAAEQAVLGPHHGGFAPGDAFLGRLLPDGRGLWVAHGTLPLLPEEVGLARRWVDEGLRGADLVAATAPLWSAAPGAGAP
jgi:hypothetical protein